MRRTTARLCLPGQNPRSSTSDSLDQSPPSANTRSKTKALSPQVNDLPDSPQSPKRAHHTPRGPKAKRKSRKNTALQLQTLSVTPLGLLDETSNPETSEAAVIADNPGPAASDADVSGNLPATCPLNPSPIV
ncbi:hypothetical protein DL93DRAFT_2168922 [Clavulina sp. PMI_390]|nr:hypothetical protein DL93DRAFT_2168922 [Clavulina sp. PMI_390]